VALALIVPLIAMLNSWPKNQKC